MQPASLFRPFLLGLALCAAALGAAAKPDAAQPVPFKQEARFSRRIETAPKPDQEAVKVSAIRIEYPKEWRSWGQPGYAVLAFVVKDTGFTEQVQCIEATDRAFAKAAVKAVENAFFQPALKNQQGVASKVVRRFEILPPRPVESAQPAAATKP